MIHRFRVQNFKSIIDVTVELSPVTVLVGRSGTGKSNFVQSLRYLRDVLSTDLNQMQIWSGKWPTVRPAIQSEKPTRFAVEFSIPGIEDHFSYVLSLGTAGPERNPIEERLDIGQKCLFHQGGPTDRGRTWLNAPEILPVPEPGLIALGRIPAISEVVIAYTALTSGIGCYAFSDKVLCGEKQNPPTMGLDDEGKNYLNTLKDIATNLQDLKVRKSIVGALQRVNPSVASVELNDHRQPSHIVVGHKFNGKIIPLQLSQESDGFRRFYAHLLALYQRPPKQTMIFEHPEDGIHPGALSLLAEEFKAAPLDERGQIILTTHSPKLLDQFDADQIRVVELDGFATRIGFVSDEQKEAMHEKLLDPGELLTVDPARIQQEDAPA